MSILDLDWFNGISTLRGLFHAVIQLIGKDFLNGITLYHKDPNETPGKAECGLQNSLVGWGWSIEYTDCISTKR